MKLKGHTTFELTNTETGEKRVIEEDNIITSFLDAFLAQTGRFNYNLMSMYNCSQNSTGRFGNMIDEFTKGLMLFEDAIDEDPENIWPRSGNKMTGQGSNITYTGNNTRAGSYNNNESGQIDGGWRHVWDFSTNQANGQIGCACLSSVGGGRLGAGGDLFSSDWSHEARRFQMMEDGMSGAGYMSQQYTSRPPFLIDYENNCAYQLKGCFGNSYYYEHWQRDDSAKDSGNSFVLSKQITIRKVEIPTTMFGLFSPIPKNSEKLIEEFTIQMPQEIVDSISDYDTIMSGRTYYTRRIPACYNVWGRDLYVYIHFAGITSSNRGSNRALGKDEDFFIIDIDLVEKKATSIKYKNTTGTTLTSVDYDWEHMFGTGDDNTLVDGVYACQYGTALDWSSGPIYVTDKYLIMHMSDGYIYRVLRSDNTNVVRFKKDGVDMTAGSGADRNNHFKFIPLGKTPEQWAANKVYAKRHNTSDRTYMFDFDEATVEWVPSSRDTVSYCQTGDYRYSASLSPVLGIDHVCYAGCWSGWNYPRCPGNYLNIFMLPFFLVSINNLSSPVQKTSAETMKVTYTLTEVVE